MASTLDMTLEDILRTSRKVGNGVGVKVADASKASSEGGGLTRGSRRRGGRAKVGEGRAGDRGVVRGGMAGGVARQRGLLDGSRVVSTMGRRGDIGRAHAATTSRSAAGQPRAISSLAVGLMKAAAAAVKSTARVEGKTGTTGGGVAKAANTDQKRPQKSDVILSGDALHMSLDDVIKTQVTKRTSKSSGGMAGGERIVKSTVGGGGGIGAGGRRRGGRKNRLKVKKDSMVDRMRERMRATAKARSVVRSNGGVGDAPRGRSGIEQRLAERRGGRGQRSEWGPHWMGKGSSKGGSVDLGWPSARRLSGVRSLPPVGLKRNRGDLGGIFEAVAKRPRRAHAEGIGYPAPETRFNSVAGSFDADEDESPRPRRLTRRESPVLVVRGRGEKLAPTPAVRGRVEKMATVSRVSTTTTTARGRGEVRSNIRPKVAAPPEESSSLERPPPRAKVSQGTKIKVANVPKDLTARDIKEAFEDLGRVTKCTVDRGIAFVVFEHATHAKKAISTFDRGELNGQTIFVSLEP